MTLSLESLTRLISLNDTKANVTALTGTPTEVIVARATDTSEIGIYAGGSWHWIGSGAGTVTSVALTVPAEFSIAGSPVTSSGTLAITKATETANTVWAGPTSGSAAQPAFRALVAADIPAGIAAVVGPLLLSDSAGSPIVFGDILQNEAQTDLMYADP